MKKLLIGLLALGSISSFAQCNVELKGNISDEIKVDLLETGYNILDQGDNAGADYIVTEKTNGYPVDYFGVSHYQGSYYKTVTTISFSKSVAGSESLDKTLFTAQGSDMEGDDVWNHVPAISFGNHMNKASRRFLRKLSRKVGACE